MISLSKLFQLSELPPDSEFILKSLPKSKFNPLPPCTPQNRISLQTHFNRPIRLKSQQSRERSVLRYTREEKFSVSDSLLSQSKISKLSMSSIRTKTSQAPRNSPQKLSSFFKTSKQRAKDRCTNSKDVRAIRKLSKRISAKVGKRSTNPNSPSSYFDPPRPLSRPPTRKQKAKRRRARKTAPAKSSSKPSIRPEKKNKLQQNHFHIDLSKATRRAAQIHSDRVAHRRNEKDDFRIGGLSKMLNQTSEARRGKRKASNSNSESVVKALRRVFKNKLKDKENRSRFAWLLKDKNGGRERLTDRTKNIIGMSYFDYFNGF